MMRLNNDTKNVVWCGPAAISMVTGFKVSVIVAMHKEISHRSRVSAMSNDHMCTIMHRLGWEIVANRWYMGSGATVAEACKAHAGQVAIMATPAHFFVSDGEGRVADNAHPALQPVELSGLADELCEHVIVWRKTGWAPKLALPGTVFDATDKKLLAQARKLARQFGIDIEKDDDAYWVTHPAFDEEDDPLAGEHVAYNGEETLAKVMTYAQALQLQTV